MIKTDKELKKVLTGMLIALGMALGFVIFPWDMTFQTVLKLISTVAIVGIGLLIIKLYQNASRISGITFYSSKLR